VLAAYRAANEYAYPVCRATYHSALGETESVVEWLGKAVEQRCPVSFAFLATTQNEMRSCTAWPVLARKFNLNAATVA
jgi:hypothetical protein